MSSAPIESVNDSYSIQQRRYSIQHFPYSIQHFPHSIQQCPHSIRESRKSIPQSLQSIKQPPATIRQRLKLIPTGAPIRSRAASIRAGGRPFDDAEHGNSIGDQP
jgi:hypothetical protein